MYTHYIALKNSSKKVLTKGERGAIIINVVASEQRPRRRAKLENDTETKEEDKKEQSDFE